MEQRETRYGHYRGRGLTIVASLQATVSDHTEDQRLSSLARWPQTVARGRKSVLRHCSNFFRVLKNIPCSFFFLHTLGDTTVFFCSLLHLRNCALMKAGAILSMLGCHSLLTCHPSGCLMSWMTLPLCGHEWMCVYLVKTWRCEHCT